jgi:beta-galactosidase
MRYLSGTTKLPFVPEFGSGIWSHHPRTPTPAEQEFVTLAALMHGMRAVNFYMLVERERWQGSPIKRDGAYRPEYADFYHRLSAFLRQYPLGALSPQKEVIVLLNYDLGRYEAMASTLHYAHVDLLRLPDKLKMVDLDLGFRWDVAQEADHDRPDNWLGRAVSQLQELHVDYDLADTHLNFQRLRRYPIACVPTVDFLDAADQRRLLDYVAAGGRLIFGPGLPYLDSDLRPASILSEVALTPGETLFGQGSISWVSADAIATALARYMPAPTIQWDISDVEVVERCGELQRLLFIANPTEREQEVTITLNERRRLFPVWGGRASPVLGDQVSVNLAPYTVQIWEASVD